MKKALLSFLLTSIAVSLSAAYPADSVKHWKTKLETSLGFSQTTLSNWNAGGENTLATNGLLNYFADYKKNKFTWNNYFSAGYGIIKQESFPTWRKADDKINFFTKAGIYAWKHWDYTALFDFKSQFAKGYKYPNDSVYLSRFMAPGYLQFSVGLSYKPVSYFSVLIAPIGSRITLVNNERLSQEGAYGVEPGEKLLHQVGGSINAIFKKDLVKNVNLMSKLDLFSNYLKNPENIIVNWENLLMLKVNKFISTSIATHLIYDDNIAYKDKEGNLRGARTQFKETFTVGFAYSLSR